MAAFLQAQTLAAAESSALPPADGAPAVPGNLVGVACTASLASDRPKRGAHRIHVASQSGSTTASCSIELVKGRRSRVEEERLAGALILNAISLAAGVTERLPVENLADEPLVEARSEAPIACQRLLARTVPAVRSSAGETTAVSDPLAPPAAGRRVLFPGAFNPLHDGHRGMAAVAAEMLGLPVEFELSIENVDKPPLDFFEIAERLRRFSPEQTIWLTRAPTFDRKAAIFANATFIVGVDTIRRIADPQYYNGDPEAATAAIERIAAAGGRFLVFGRATEGRFETLAQCGLPDCLKRISTEVPAEQFRSDVSSTAFRRLHQM